MKPTIDRVTAALGVVLCVATLIAGCGTTTRSGSSGTESDLGSGSTIAGPVDTVRPATTTTLRVYPPGAFDQTDVLFNERIRSAGLGGGMIRIARADGSLIHEMSIGSVSGSTPLSVASSTKWLTAATFMTFVDQGVIGLDDDISRWLPEFASSSPAITPRQLLDHTSGVRDNRCQGGGTSLAGCVTTIAASAREFPAGARFSYGNSDFLVVGRLVEVLGGADFATIVDQRITGPLQMTATSWPGAPAMANSAFGVRVTIDDYGRFLDMLLHRGQIGDLRVLSEASVAMIVSNQVAAYDTTKDFSVGITKIPRYGLGCWPDVVDGFGATVVVSGNGGMGFYPWVDYETNTWGIVGVQDERGAQLAVPASKKVQSEARNALSR